MIQISTDQLNINMNFRKFLEASGGLNTANFGANVKWDIWGFPSLNQQGLLATKTPIGGHQSVGGIVQQQQSISNFNDPDYNFQIALEAIANLAENIPAFVDHNKSSIQQDPNFVGPRYKYADYDKIANMIYGLTMNDIVAGAYPRVKPADVNCAETMHVIIPFKLTGNINNIPHYNPADGELYNIDIESLKKAMIEMSNKLNAKNQQHAITTYQAGQADKALNAMSSPGMLQLDKSANPFK